MKETAPRVYLTNLFKHTWIERIDGVYFTPAFFRGVQNILVLVYEDSKDSYFVSRENMCVKVSQIF